MEGIKEHGGGYYMFTTAATKLGDIGSKMAPMMDKVSAFMQQNKIMIAGMPFTIYNDWDEVNGTVIFSTALPVNETDHSYQRRRTLWIYGNRLQL